MDFCTVAVHVLLMAQQLTHCYKYQIVTIVPDPSACMQR